VRAILVGFPCAPLCPRAPAVIQAAPPPARFPAPFGGGAVKFLCVRAAEGGLLQRPGDEAIGHAIRRSMHELVTASIEMAGDCAFGGLPAVFFIE
jgi:hypothetical protein